MRTIETSEIDPTTAERPEKDRKPTPEEMFAGFLDEFKRLQDLSTPISWEERFELLEGLHARVTKTLNSRQMKLHFNKRPYPDLQALSLQISFYKDNFRPQKAA